LEASFPTLIEERGLCIKEVAGDGNCMFRALSDQLYGTELYHSEVKNFALAYILQ
jgi:OTU domain-containing protein 5